MSKEDSTYIDGALFVVALCFLTCIGFLSYGMFAAPVEAEFDCAVEGIEYIKLEDAKCWNDGFSDNHCPVPKDIKCKGRAKMSSVMLDTLLNE